ncbi:hypothetical protein CTAYLR_005128 [Chrysophaeum taylorii]|uniref:tRNA/rRNA methyltransferase SpoU type domain-containing protein n=1 Tax=Chrysophaeum taylorii TaxID=2483200 RepID=A0AAD7XLY3_9STRA|nr:hypothetical protein CTAYLR_005128 [Chrysophaeum taylorii]
MPTFGAHGAERRVPIRAFESLDLLVDFAKRQDCDVVGIEIHPDAVPSSAAFSEARPSCFMPGNEGDGLSAKQLALCDRLVYVPHYGTATASLNVNAAVAVVLSAFATAAGYAETDRTGAKFEVKNPLRFLTDDTPPPQEAATTELMVVRKERDSQTAASKHEDWPAKRYRKKKKADDKPQRIAAAPWPVFIESAHTSTTTVGDVSSTKPPKAKNVRFSDSVAVRELSPVTPRTQSDRRVRLAVRRAVDVAADASNTAKNAAAGALQAATSAIDGAAKYDASRTAAEEARERALRVVVELEEAIVAVATNKNECQSCLRPRSDTSGDVLLDCGHAASECADCAGVDVADDLYCFACAAVRRVVAIKHHAHTVAAGPPETPPTAKKCKVLRSSNSQPTPTSSVVLKKHPKKRTSRDTTTPPPPMCIERTPDDNSTSLELIKSAKSSRYAPPFFDDCLENLRPRRLVADDDKPPPYWLACGLFGTS